MFRYPIWKTSLILLVTAYGLLAFLPNFLSEAVRERIPAPIPSGTLSLGLDLRGGAHLLFEVKVDEVYEERLETNKEELREKLREARIGYTGLRIVDEAVHVTIRDAEQMEAAGRLIRELAQPAGGPIAFGTPVDLEINEESTERRFSIKLTEDAKKRILTSVAAESINVVQRRIDETGTREATIQRQGADRILVQVPGESDPTRIKDLVSKTARLTFQREDTSVSVEEAKAGRVPPQSRLYKMKESEGRPEILLEKRVIISGDMLQSAQQSTDNFGRPAVSFTLNTQGARRFAEFSSENVGRVFAIVLDDIVISAPVIRSAILGGQGQISGGFVDFQEAENLAILLRAGALPATLTAVEERSVGPDLGADSIEAGRYAAIIGVVLVIAYMVLSYGLFGVFASFAMLINLGMLLGALSLLGATLTLPGIAGIVLTMGMAVDANVLIFERIREEVRAGKSPLAAMETGYSKALATILDSQITTFLAGATLFFFGSGPVRGFAVVLSLGILTSIFTAVTLTRFLQAMWFRWARPKTLPV